jgi:CubicO group peptidase (beta-lactamase class C family)
MPFHPAHHFSFVLLVLALGGCAAPSGSQPLVRTAQPGGLSSEIAPAASPRKAEQPAPIVLKRDSPRDISSTLAPIIARAKIPGAAAIVLQGDRIVAEGVAGVRKKGNDSPITLNDQFEICSCTKAMGATLVALLVEDGTVRWDSTLGEIFGGAVPDMNPAWKSVTLQQMLSHRAGLTDQHWFKLVTSVVFSSSPTDQRRSMARKLLSHAPDLPPGTKAIYTNADYVMVGVALEQITGRTWEDLMQERLFRPLGITTAGFGPPGTPGRVDQSWGHGPRRLLYLPLPGATDVPFDPGSGSADYPLAAAPAGLVHMSVLDWAKFVAWHLRGDPANPHRKTTLLSADSFAHLHTADGGEIFNLPSDPKPIPNASYTSGWFTSTRAWAKGPRPGDTGRVLRHVGDNQRWNCAVWVAPEIDFAVLVALNRASMWGPCDEAAGALIREFAPKPEQVSRNRNW